MGDVIDILSKKTFILWATQLSIPILI
jgi:hypothetical protein